ncbi:phosphate signaling complex protein PhoU [Buchananella felis]|uniref:phosphate signaling complex protein PhoU n=1 Tax=Buchananella felis TaxID=3231492 RepID=UPI003528754C
MREIFHMELKQVGSDLRLMAGYVAAAMEKATEALATGDLMLAEQVIDSDERINDLHRSLDEFCISLLARQAPVAADLRLVVAAMRMSQTLERMGDLARHVASIARGRYPQAAVDADVLDLLVKMGRQASAVARRVIELVDTKDLSIAAEIAREDDVLDQLHRQTFQYALNDDHQMTRQQVVDTVLLGRFLERFGDHAVSLAHRVSYLVTGQLTAQVETEVVASAD